MTEVSTEVVDELTSKERKELYVGGTVHWVAAPEFTQPDGVHYGPGEEHFNPATYLSTMAIMHTPIKGTEGN